MAAKRTVSGHGRKLRKAREKKGWTLEDASREAGISVPRASELERRHEIPNSWAAAQYAAVLGFRIRSSRRLLREGEG
jgi:transcriptional regulator with XRE-family HTH domain